MVKLQDLFVASVAFQTTLLVITSVVIFTILNSIIFKVLPFALLTLGLLLLTSSDIISSSVPLNALFGSLDYEIVTIIGSLSIGLAWNSYFVGNSTDYLTKTGYSLLIAITTAILAYNQVKAKLTCESILIDLQTNKLFVGYVVSSLASLLVAIGHYVGPKIIAILENRDKKKSPVKC